MRAAVAAFPRSLPDNPYCTLLYEHLSAAGVAVDAAAELSASWLWRNKSRVGVLHLHWPEFYYRAVGGAVTVRSVGAFVIDLLLAVALGYRVVWTVHNALPHEPGRLDRAVRWLLLWIVYPVIHCPEARKHLGHARRRAVVIPHGSYIGWYPEMMGPEEARRHLGVGQGDKVLLCFGQLRAYKGVEELMRAFHATPGEELKLVVAGKCPSPAAAERLRAVAQSLADPRISLHLRYIRDEEVQVFFKACDLVVLPYLQVLTSGAAILGLSFGRGLIVPRTGCLNELAQQGCAIAYDPASPGTLERALGSVATADFSVLGRRSRKLAETLSWERIAAAYVELYSDLGTARARHEPETPGASSEYDGVERKVVNGSL